MDKEYDRKMDIYDIPSRVEYFEQVANDESFPLGCSVGELLEYCEKAQEFIWTNPGCSYREVWLSIDPPSRQVVSVVLGRLNAEGDLQKKVSGVTGTYVYWFEKE